jgi:hypothetical protein
MMSRVEAQNLREHVRCLAMQIGLRSAARAYNLSEARVMKWSERGRWQIGLLRPSATNADKSANVSTPIQALQNVLAIEADRTRAAMARTARRAFEYSDGLSDETLHEMPRAIALEKHARVASIAHRWQSEAVNVGVQVNVPMPDKAEREEMRAMDAKLDAIAERLRNGP